MEAILTHLSASITELKSNPNKVLEDAGGQAVAILKSNRPLAYLLPADLYKNLLEIAEDAHWSKVIKERENEPSIRVEWEDL